MYPEGAGNHPYAQHPFGFGGPFGWGRGGFGAGGWGGRGGHRGRHGPGRHGGPHERRESRERGTEEEHREGEPAEESSHGRGGRGGRNHSHHGRRRHSHSDGEHSEGERERSPHGRRGGRGFGRRGRGGPHDHERRGCRSGGPPPNPFGAGGFDMNVLLQSLSNHPLAQTFRNYAQQATNTGAGPQQSGEIVPEQEDDNTFAPPIDVFSTEKAYVLHVALPGAKKEDVEVNWDEDKGVLNVAGVVYRLGDEEFLKTLAQSERKVGVFERTVKLPPADAEKEEVDGDMISAKLEDGVLVVTVPKVEKEWTEVKKVDIE
jgi:HSP20 family protein